jgi:hypothetical protein
MEDLLDPTDLDRRNPDVIRARIRDLDSQISHGMRRIDIAREERDELLALLSRRGHRVMTTHDSDGFPVSPWHSRFVEVSDLLAERYRADRLKLFIETMRGASVDIVEAFRPYVETLQRAAAQMVALGMLFETAPPRATRRVIQSQRQRRHR